MSHPSFYLASLPLSSVLLLFGLNALLRPENHLGLLGFPLHTDPAANKLNHALMRIWGIRNLTVGSLLAFIWQTGDEGLMGKALAVTILLPVTDGFVSRLLIGGGVLQHWAFPPVIGFVAAGLLGWFD